MIIKFTMIVDTDLQPGINCSLQEFFENADILDYDYEEIESDETYELD